MILAILWKISIKLLILIKEKFETHIIPSETYEYTNVVKFYLNKLTLKFTSFLDFFKIHYLISLR